MEGKDKEISSAKTNKNVIKSESAKKTAEIDPTKDENKSGKHNNKSIYTTLKSIFSNIDKVKDHWPNEIFNRIKARFGKMPRNGWMIAAEEYNIKFNENINSSKLRKIAIKPLCGLNEAIHNNTANPHEKENINYTKKESDIVADREDEYSTEGINERKLKSLAETKLFNALYEKLAIWILNIKNGGNLNFIQTHKVSVYNIDFKVLETLNAVIFKYKEVNKIKNITDIAVLLNAAQATYQDFSQKPTKKSVWRDKMIDKINFLKRIEGKISRKLNNKTEDSLDKEVKKFFRNNRKSIKNNNHLKEMCSVINERISITKRKMEITESRIVFRKDNICFELNRGRFYRSLLEGVKIKPNIPIDEIKSFWCKIWENDGNTKVESINDYLLDFPEDLDSSEAVFPSFVEFLEIIKKLNNWKASGTDYIYNFFVKKIDCLHRDLYEVIKKICFDNEDIGEWFFTGRTFLIPKGSPTKGDEFRPITCMSSLYKITTKCVFTVLQHEVEKRKLLTENQMGVVRNTLSAKEQALLNFSLNNKYKEAIKTAWIDIKKAFDNIDHSYLLKCIEKLKIPRWIEQFIKRITENWKIELNYDGEVIQKKQIRKGILQGDSLSPLLFVLCLDPLSRKLNSIYPLLSIESTEKKEYATNHLLFVDDLKLFAESEHSLQKMVNEVRCFLENTGLMINYNKSATNSVACESYFKKFDYENGYKYLGIIENSKGEQLQKNIISIKEVIANRVEILCQTKLNSRNLFAAINEFALSVLNYYIGVLKIEAIEFEEIDKMVRQILNRYSIHIKPSNKHRLYLQRNQLGRGLASAEQKNEVMNLNLFNYLNKNKRSERQNAILISEIKGHTFLSLIKEFLKIKYELKEDDDINGNYLKELQKNRLLREILNKQQHKKLFKSLENGFIDLKKSTTWLKIGNNKPQDEGAFCALQDRNIFYTEIKNCTFCNGKKRTVDHIATKCKKLLRSEYYWRHDEILKSIHLNLCLKYGIINKKRIKDHNVNNIILNNSVEIRVDSRINTNTKIKHNKPDILVIDKVKKTITLIEIGVTCSENLTMVERDKKVKYELLLRELECIYKYKCRVVPFVCSWDGFVTNFNKTYNQELDISDNILSYIQSRVLRKTLESVSREASDHKFNGKCLSEENVESLMSQFYKEDPKG